MALHSSCPGRKVKTFWASLAVPAYLLTLLGSMQPNLIQSAEDYQYECVLSFPFHYNNCCASHFNAFYWAFQLFSTVIYKDIPLFLEFDLPFALL
jgi:hypothetical protein